MAMRQFMIRVNGRPLITSWIWRSMPAGFDFTEVAPLPIFTVLPSITTDGSPEVGDTLTGVSGTVAMGSVSARQWLRNGEAIEGETGLTYTLVTADLGASITLRETATGSGGETVATSAAVGPVLAPLIEVTRGSTAADTGNASTSPVQFLAEPTTQDCTLVEISARFAATGTGQFHVVQIQPNTKTVEVLAIIPVTIAAVGVNTFPLDVEVPAGSFIGYKRLTGNNVRFAAGGRNFSVAGGSLTAVGSTGTFTAATADLAISYTVEERADLSGGALQEAMTLGAGWNHAEADGQSNSIAADAVPLINTTPLADHKTFNASTRMTKPSLAAGASDDGLIKALVEDTVAPFSGTYGDTGLTAFAESFGGYYGGTDPVWFASAPARGGLALVGGIDFLTPVYENKIYHVAAAKAAADALSIDYRVPVCLFDHGESDQQAGTPKAFYKKWLGVHVDRFNWEAMALTGQTQAPFWLFTTSPWHIKTSSGASEAILEMCDERSDCWFVAPGYRFPHENNTHLSAAGQTLKRHYQSRAAAQLAEGQEPDRLRWVSASASGTTFTAIIEGPTPATFDTTIIPAVTDYGIRIVDDTGALALSGLAVGTPVEVSPGVWRTPITGALSRAVEANPRFQYALDHEVPWPDVAKRPTNGAGGNVFDTTATTVTIDGTSYSMAHGAPPVRLAMTV